MAIKTATPEGVEYWLDPDTVGRTCKEINGKILTQEPGAIANYLRTSHNKNIWARIAFPEEISEIRSKYAREGDPALKSTNEENEEILTKSRELTNLGIAPPGQLELKHVSQLNDSLDQAIEEVKSPRR